MLRLQGYIQVLEANCRRNFANNAKRVETYYDVLNLRHDCSQRDIRNAYLRLSKQYHPDVRNAKSDGAARFVQITEAYQTLVKATSRRAYDDSLLWTPGVGKVNEGAEGGTHHPWEVRPNYDSNPGPYYGIKGLNRVSNLRVALFFMALCIAGAIFGFSSVKHSYELRRKIQDEISAEANSHHASVVAAAQKYGNEEQIKRMLERLANDPIAKAAAK